MPIARRPSRMRATQRLLSQLQDGEVDAALAETMRLPGAPYAQPWIRQARQYVAVHRALDEIESGALLARSGSSRHLKGWQIGPRMRFL